LIIKGKKINISFLKVDDLTNKDRWKNQRFRLANLDEIHQSDYRKSRSDERKRGCQENDFWQKIQKNSL
jgi:hypothetical protein